MEDITQTIQTIEAWSQESVIISDTQKHLFVAWCQDISKKFEKACQSPLKIGLIGGTGVGKSTIINRMAGTDISVAHDERPYTDKVIVYQYQHINSELGLDPKNAIICKHERQEISHLILFDFPDYDSHLSEHRLMVQDISQKLDILVWVASPEKYADQAMIHMMSTLFQSSQNYCFVLNKTDLLHQDEIAQIIGHWHLLLRQSNILEAPIFAISASNDHDHSFQSFQNWIFKKRSEHELKEISRANIENQIKQKTQQMRQQIDSQQITHVVEDLNNQVNLLNTFNNMREKDILELISPDALTSIHQYLSRQSRFVWPVGLAFGWIGHLRQWGVDRPTHPPSKQHVETYLQTIDNAIEQIQTIAVVPDSNISLLNAFHLFIDQYQDPNQIARLLGKIGFFQSIFFWIKQWFFICLPMILCMIYLSGVHQLESIESIAFSTFLMSCFQIMIKLFQPEGLVAMISLLFIELFLCMQLA